jgi:hypothetical protein
VKTLLLAASLLATLPLSANPGEARPARYTPDKGDFVITNGSELFNRPLYGGNSGFRIEAGDRPEFALFLPGRGGNLRLLDLIFGLGGLRGLSLGWELLAN